MQTEFPGAPQDGAGVRVERRASARPVAWLLPPVPESVRAQALRPGRLRAGAGLGACNKLGGDQMISEMSSNPTDPLFLAEGSLL